MTVEAMVFVLYMLNPDTMDFATPRDMLVKGILANRGSYNYVTEVYAKRLVKEAIEVTSYKGNSWMPPAILLGLAINETDLRWWVQTGKGSVLDCGICQNHVPLFARSYGARVSLCRRLKKSTKLSFMYAMKELNHVNKLWCRKWTKDRYRCLLNLYNQGPRYFRRLNCRFKSKARVLRCRHRNRYWLRGLCFSYGIRIGKKPRFSCRKARSLKWIYQSYHYDKHKGVK